MIIRTRAKDIVNKLDFNSQINVIREDVMNIRLFYDPCEDLQGVAVHMNPLAIFLIKHPTDNVKKFVVAQYPWMIRFMPRAHIEVQLIAVEALPSVIKYIHNPDPIVQITAIKKDITTIKLIKHPTLNVMDTLININPLALQFIKNPPEDIVRRAFKLVANHHPANGASMYTPVNGNDMPGVEEFFKHFFEQQNGNDKSPFED
jgi:hypothetical protein